MLLLVTFWTGSSSVCKDLAQEPAGGRFKTKVFTSSAEVPCLEQGAEPLTTPRVSLRGCPSTPPSLRMCMSFVWLYFGPMCVKLFSTKWSIKYLVYSLHRTPNQTKLRNTNLFSSCVIYSFKCFPSSGVRMWLLLDKATKPFVSHEVKMQN